MTQDSIYIYISYFLFSSFSSYFYLYSVHIYKLRHWLWHCCDGELECHSTPQWTGIVDYHIKDVHTDQITSIHFAPLIECIFTSSLDGTCAVISYERKQVKKVFRDHKNAAYDVIWCDSKRV